MIQSLQYRCRISILTHRLIQVPMVARIRASSSYQRTRYTVIVLHFTGERPEKLYLRHMHSAAVFLTDSGKSRC